MEHCTVNTLTVTVIRISSEGQDGSPDNLRWEIF